MGSSPLERLGPVLEVLGDLHVRAVGVDLLGAEVLAVALLDPAGEDLRRPFVIRLEEVLAERDSRRSRPTSGCAVSSGWPVKRTPIMS